MHPKEADLQLLALALALQLANYRLAIVLNREQSLASLKYPPVLLFACLSMDFYSTSLYFEHYERYCEPYDTGY